MSLMNFVCFPAIFSYAKVVNLVAAQYGAIQSKKSIFRKPFIEQDLFRVLLLSFC